MRFESRVRALEDRARQLEPHGGVATEPEPECQQESFDDWLPRVSPGWSWHWPHLELIRQKLALVTAGLLLRLAIFLPPQHGKSEQTTIRYPVYRLKQNPALRVVVGAYNHKYASKFGRKAQRIAAADGVVLNPRCLSADDWETADGGGFRSVGVGSGVTGNPADLLIIDDPVKDREEADSEVYQERSWEWYTESLVTRLQPNAPQILIMTLWNQNDLGGRILSSEEGPLWDIVDLPAEALTQEERDQKARKWGRPTGQPDLLGRQPGEPLCPERFSLDALRSRRAVLGRRYYALYQQWPQPLEGSMFRREWFKLIDIAPKEAVWHRYWDKAGTKDGGANTAGVLMGRTKAGIYIVANCTVAQLEAAEREGLIRTQAQLDAVAWSRVKTRVEQEPGSGGKESAQGTVRNLAGFDVSADRVTGDKVLRAEPWAAQLLAGNVYLVKGPWNQAYIDEHCDFPSGKRKDRVDASSGAFAGLGLGFQPWSRPM